MARFHHHRAFLAAALWASATGCSSVGSVNHHAVVHAADQEAYTARIPRLELLESDPSEYRIGPRDLLEIDIYELESPTETKRIKVRVSQGGNVLLPLIGSVPAVGSTATELQQAIEARLREDFIREPSVSVLVSDFQSRRVTVLGEVHSPGTFELRENSTTLINALALAGSPNEKAGTRAFILRARRTKARGSDSHPGPGVDPALTAPQDDTIGPPAPAPGGAGPRPAAPDLGGDLADRLVEVDLTELITNGNLAFNYSLQDGDLVHVPKASMCFVTGLVHYPGAFPVKDKVTIMRALALAGGAREHVTPSMTVLLRMTSQGRVAIPIDLDKVKGGTKSDMEMRAGDVLVLAESGGSKFRRGVLDFFRGLFTVGYAVR